MAPRAAYAEAKNIVDLIRADAATAIIKVHKLRGGVSVLEGSGAATSGYLPDRAARS